MTITTLNQKIFFAGKCLFYLTLPTCQVDQRPQQAEEIVNVSGPPGGSFITAAVRNTVRDCTSVPPIN